MITTDFAWVDEYYNWLRGNASAKQLQNGWTEIVIGDLLADGMTLLGKTERNNPENIGKLKAA